MSEALEGMPPAPPAPPPRDASVAVLYRSGPSGVEVFWLKRERSLRFAGGFYAFPGGRVDREDVAVPVGGFLGSAPMVVAAARELLEEAGVLKARGVERLGPGELEQLRRAVLEGSGAFGPLLAAHGLRLEAADFPPAGRWVTPPWFPIRYDTRFHLVAVPEGQRATVWKGELESGEWIRPSEALARWSAGTALLHPPNLHVMRVMARFESEAQALAELRVADDFMPSSAEFQEGVVSVPLRTPTLPPATHTNTYVLGTGERLVVDPGASDEGELEVLRQHLSARGGQPLAIVLTHHHLDHVGGVSSLVAELGLPVWAHEETAARLSLKVERRLAEGDELALDGPLPMRWKVLHTPGHTRGHLTLVEERSRAAVVGDMVAGLGTIVIDPPEGDMAEYLRQLERLKAHVGTVYPAHGPAIPDGVAKLDEYLAHRRWREGKVLAALSSFDRPALLREVALVAYDDVAAVVLTLAERSTHAILEKLRLEGRATTEGARWRPAP